MRMRIEKRFFSTLIVALTFATVAEAQLSPCQQALGYANAIITKDTQEGPVGEYIREIKLNCHLLARASERNDAKACRKAFGAFVKADDICRKY